MSALPFHRSDTLWSRAEHLLANVYFIAIVVTGAAFLLYARTVAPTVLPGDSGEFQFAAWGFWLAHPTGYPLYLLLGGIWQHLVQVGDPAFRMNLFSGFWSALAVGVSFLLFWNVTRERAGAAIAALTLAVVPLFWSQATRAEVYALNSFFIALLTLWGVLWHSKPQRKYATAFALTFGLSLAHHRTTILLVPAFAALFADRLFLLLFDRKQLAKRAIFYGVLAAVPLLLYLYIPLRAGATPYATLDLSPAAPIVVFENSPRGWLTVVLGSGFAGALGVGAAAWNGLGDFANQWLAQLNPLGVLLSLFGFAVLLWRRNFPLAAFVLFGSATFLAFDSVYHIGDIADYYTPLYIFSCLAIAVGMAFIVQQARAFSPLRSNLLPTIALLAAFTLLPMQNLGANFFSQDRARQTTTRSTWANIFAAKLPDNAILLSNDRDEMTPLYYLQRVEKQKPGWLGVFPKIAPGASYDNVIALVKRVAPSGRPIYAIKPVPSLLLRYSMDDAGNDLWQVHPFAPGTPQHPTDQVVGSALQVRGYSLVAGEPLGGERITVAVQYVPLKKLARDYTTSVQLFDVQDKKVAQGNDHVPGDTEYPSTKWVVGETIQDRFDIQLDPSLAGGDYKIMLRVYEPSSGDELGDLTQVGVLKIEE